MNCDKLEQPGTGQNEVPSSNVELGTRIKAICDRLGSRRKAAEIGGVSEDMIYKYIAGSTSPRFDVIARLAQAAGVSLQWFAYGQGQMESGHFKGWEEEDVHPIGQIAQVVYEAIYDAKNLVPPDTFMNLMTELYSLHINDIKPDDPEFQRVQRMMRVALSTKQSG